jgi:hypothetical protein
MKKNLFFYIFLIFFIILSLVGFIYFSKIEKSLVEKFPNLRFTKYLFKNESLLNKINNDYNVKFLPDTEFVKLNFRKKKINFKDKYYKPPQDKSVAYTSFGTFFFEIYDGKILIVDFLGNIYVVNNLKDSTSTENLKSTLSAKRVYDTLIIKDKLYISYATYLDGCKKINVSFSKLELNNLRFKKLFESSKCEENGVPGRMQYFVHNNKKGILLSTAGGSYDNPGDDPQNKSSLFGKILFIELKSKKNYLYSYGHRVIQGLFAANDIILSTEHGPRGGDEVNKILFEKNYGWPIASYGEKYSFDYEKKPTYKKNHQEEGFEEPLFSFITAIGISEIIKLPNNFSPHYENKFIISSLFGRSIFIVNFDKNFTRVINYEKIFLNERIRDLKYDIKNKLIILALEENGELGILSLK